MKKLKESPLENKTTSELLDLIGEYSVKERNEAEISDKEVDEYVESIKELQNRAPFNLIFTEDYYSEESKTLEERIDNLEENHEDFEKKVRRHKHDILSGDVMIRI